MAARSKDEVAQELADAHFRVEPDLKTLYWIVPENENENENEPIKLLEVNAATVASGSGEVYAFAPTREFPYRTAIAEVTPEEFEHLGKGSSVHREAPSRTGVDGIAPRGRGKGAEQGREPKGLVREDGDEGAGA
jgi:hypothetical protein